MTIEALDDANMIKTIIFDLDDTLFDSTDLVARGRLEACKAMIDLGLKENSVDAVYNKLKEIVDKVGTNHPNHYDELVKFYNKKSDAKIVAAGIIAYHNVKISQIRPYPRARELLTHLMKRGHKLVLITRGVPAKQWEKILRLEIAELFDNIYIVNSERKENKNKVFFKVKKELRLNEDETVAVGNKLDPDITAANKVGFISVRVLQGKYKNQKPSRKAEEARHTIQKIPDLKELLEKINS